MHKPLLLFPLLLAGCVSTPPVKSPLPTALVTAKLETQPVATMEDAADDPAIWRDAANPAQSLIIGTDKRAGVHVYDLQGRQVGFTPSPRLNNVDLRDVGAASVSSSPPATVRTLRRHRWRCSGWTLPPRH